MSMQDEMELANPWQMPMVSADAVLQVGNSNEVMSYLRWISNRKLDYVETIAGGFDVRIIQT